MPSHSKSAKKKQHKKSKRSGSSSPKVVRKSYSLLPEASEELSKCWSDLSKGRCPSKKRVVQCYCKGRPYKDDKRNYKVETKAQALKRWAKESGSTSATKVSKKPSKSGYGREIRMKIYKENQAEINALPAKHWATQLKNFLAKHKPEDFDSKGKLKVPRHVSPKHVSPKHVSPRTKSPKKKSSSKSPKKVKSPGKSHKTPKKVKKIESIGEESDISSIFSELEAPPEIKPPPRPSTPPRPSKGSTLISQLEESDSEVQSESSDEPILDISG